MKSVTTLKLLLTRHIFAGDHTGGVLKVGKHNIDTIERPFDDGHKGTSCLPLGRYRMHIERGSYCDYRLHAVGCDGFSSQRLIVSGSGLPLSCHIKLDGSYCVADESGQDDDVININDILYDVIAGVKSATLDIVAVNPYVDYINNHGYTKIKTEE